MLITSTPLNQTKTTQAMIVFLTSTCGAETEAHRPPSSRPFGTVAPTTTTHSTTIHEGGSGSLLTNGMSNHHTATRDRAQVARSPLTTKENSMLSKTTVKDTHLWHQWLARHNPALVKASGVSYEDRYFDTAPADQDTRDDYKQDKRDRISRYGKAAYKTTRQAEKEAHWIAHQERDASRYQRELIAAGYTLD